MSSQRNTGAFIIGGVLGGLVGAAVTLWNTPKSGDELRSMLSGGSSGASEEARVDDRREGQPVRSGRFSNPVLSFVEKAAAPLVGVELGKLAKDDPDATRQTPVRASAADAKPPAAHGEPDSVQHSGPDTTDVQSPEEELTHDVDEGSSAHVASVEDLTTPPPAEEVTPTSNRAPADVPDPPSNKTH